MTRIKLVLTMTLIAIALSSCKWKVHKWTVPFINGYGLSYHEAVPDDAFFIVHLQQVVVPPQVTEVA